MDFLKLVSDVGFPIASACVGFYFVYLTLKFILEGVLSEIRQQIQIVQQLDTRITAMTKDILRIDALASKILGLPAEDTLVKGKDDLSHRKD